MTDLDHIAIATTDPAATLDALVGTLGGVCMYGGDGYGFRWMQVRMGDDVEGMTVEVLVVWRPEVNDFLARFLARSGPGQHHVTFKVDDLATTLERVRGAGFTPVGVNLTDPEWKEAFLIPREAHGTVVQLAQTHDEHPTMAEELQRSIASPEPRGNPVWWPAPPRRAPDPVVLRRAVIATPSLPAGLGLFAGLLDGQVDDEGAGHAELVWPGGGRIRLEARDDRLPGVDRLEGERAGEPLDLVVSGTRFRVRSRATS